jgi:Putative transposase DNA-binding domain
MRTHICPGCGLILDRDYNAALNILITALELYLGAQGNSLLLFGGVGNAWGDMAATAAFERIRQQVISLNQEPRAEHSRGVSEIEHRNL